MKIKWIVLVVILLIGITIFVLTAKPGWRILVYNDGLGSPDIEMASSGHMTITIGPDGDYQMTPVWELPGTEIRIKDSVKFLDVLRLPGERLIVNKDKEIENEDFFYSLYRDLKYFVYKLKNKDAYKQKKLYTRAEEVRLRKSVTDVPEGVVLKFGTEITTLDEQEDWIKIRSEQPKARGWLHKATTTDSEEQIKMLKSENSIPKLILGFVIGKDSTIHANTLAGSMVVQSNDNTYQIQFSSSDCIVFEKAHLEKFPKPFSLAGNCTIKEPNADKIYFFNTQDSIEILDLVTFKK